MRENPEFLAWIDLETTGSTVADNEILEVGLVVTDATPRLGVLLQASWVVYPKEEDRLLVMKDVVVDMHIKSGLLADVLKMKYPRPYIEKVDLEVAEALKPFTGATNLIPLAGSGVSHFDIRFIEKYMPATKRLLTYAPYDVGSVRRWLRLVGIQNDIDDGKTHRALDDARVHASEAREYLSLFEKLKGE